MAKNGDTWTMLGKLKGLKIGYRIGLLIACMVTISIVSSGINQYFGSRIHQEATEVNDKYVPKAVSALSMLEELGDMNSNVLEYLTGEADEISSFEDNYKEFRGFFDKYKAVSSENADDVQAIESYISTYYNAVKTQAFSHYDPEAEKAANAEADRLTNMVGKPMEEILEALKEAEIADAGSSGDMYEIVNDDLPGVQYYLELVGESGDMLRSLNAYMRGKMEARDDFKKDAAAFAEFMTKIRPLERKPNEVQELDKVEALYKQLLAGGDKIFSSFNPRAKREATKAVDDLEHGLFSKLEKTLDHVTASAQEAQANELNDLMGNVEFANMLVWALLAATIGVSAVILILITNTVVRPLQGLTERMGQLADGNLDVEIDQTERLDEVGDMAKTMQVFKNNMLENRKLQTQTEKEQTARNVRASKVDALTQAFDEEADNMLTIVGSSASQLQDTAMKLSATAEESARQAASVSSASTEASSNVLAVAAATEELTNSIQEVSQRMNDSSKLATNAVDEAESGRRLVQQLVEGASEIEDVVSLISTIAEQTNLLALNATIEAARAGEAGKGFAVVAAEVKTLANQTAKATEDIRSRIERIQNDTGTAASSIDSVSERMREMSEIFSSVNHSIETQTETIREIAGNVHHAAEGTKEVSNNIEGVDTAAKDTSQSSSHVLESSESLNAKSQELRTIVQKFLSDVRAA